MYKADIIGCGAMQRSYVGYQPLCLSIKPGATKVGKKRQCEWTRRRKKPVVRHVSVLRPCVRLFRCLPQIFELQLDGRKPFIKQLYDVFRQIQRLCGNEHDAPLQNDIHITGFRHLLRNHNHFAENRVSCTVESSIQPSPAILKPKLCLPATLIKLPSLLDEDVGRQNDPFRGKSLGCLPEDPLLFPNLLLEFFPYRIHLGPHTLCRLCIPQHTLNINESDSRPHTFLCLNASRKSCREDNKEKRKRLQPSPGHADGHQKRVPKLKRKDSVLSKSSFAIAVERSRFIGPSGVLQEIPVPTEALSEPVSVSAPAV